MWLKLYRLLAQSVGLLLFSKNTRIIHSRRTKARTKYGQKDKIFSLSLTEYRDKSILCPAEDKIMSEDEKSLDIQKKKHRSPNYPVISIDESIDKLRQVYRQDKRALTTYEAITGHLGFTAKKRSGRSARVVAALRQYGLLDEQAGKFRVSDLGFKILEMPEDSQERGQLIKEAALNPPAFRKLLNYYDGELPSDAALRSHLIFQEKFNPESVPDFIRVFRRTMEVANPSPSDYTAGEESEVVDRPAWLDEQPLFGGKPMQQQSARTTQERIMAQPQATSVNRRDFPLYLSKHQQGVLSVPSEMSQKDYDLLKQQIDNHMAIILVTSVIDEKENEG
jgi:hypothetical protein